MTTTSPATTPQRAHWWRLDPAGSTLGFVFAILSVTPSLLPRPAVFQGILAAVAFCLGYLIGALLWAIVRKLIWKRGNFPQIRPIWWVMYAAMWIGAAAALSTLSTLWQNDVRRLVSMPPLDGVDIAGFALSFLPAVVLLLIIGKSVRVLTIRLRRRLGGFFGTLMSAVIVFSTAAGVLCAALIGVDRIYYERNHLPEAVAVEPGSEFRSAGPESAIPWHTVGRHGGAFLSGGPTAETITELTGHDAQQPIRVYAGLESAATIDERAQLVVDELERTGAFDRKILVLATTTGSGWLEPQTVDAVEYLHAGDTAIASMQYAYTPSWVSFLFDQDAPIAAADALFAAVEERLEQLPASERPALYSYGLSLGAHGSQAIFDDVADLRARTDGALFVGSPNGSELWRTLQTARDAGSPAWQPVLNDGAEVRWYSRAGDVDLLPGPWATPRVLYAQHATDPITWLAPELIWQAPDWLSPEQRSADISPEMRWIPLITALQVTLDMLVSEAVPAAYGHNYGDVVLPAWQHLTPETPLTNDALQRVQTELESYAAIPMHEE